MNDAKIALAKKILNIKPRCPGLNPATVSLEWILRGAYMKEVEGVALDGLVNNLVSDIANLLEVRDFGEMLRTYISEDDFETSEYHVITKDEVIQNVLSRVKDDSAVAAIPITENAGQKTEPTKDAEKQSDRRIGKTQREMAGEIMSGQFQVPWVPEDAGQEPSLRGIVAKYYENAGVKPSRIVKLLQLWHDFIAGTLPEMQTRRTFDALFKEHRMTAEERRDLAHHLASMRYKNTLEALIPSLEVSRGPLKEHDEPSA